VARRKQPGSLDQVRAVMWEGIEMLQIHLSNQAAAADSKELCSLMHALAQAAGTYAKLKEVGEFEEELADMRRELNEVAKAARGSTLTA
jgi:hypothetical protein